MTDEFDLNYDAAVAGMELFGSTLERLIESLLDAEEIHVHSVTSRVKKRASVSRKLQRSSPERSIDTLTDLLGIRIITYFRDEVDSVARVIDREFSVDPDNSVDKRAVLAPDRFGYLSLHYVCQVGASRARLPEYHTYENIRFEIQIRSILQHAWAEIEHDLGYKSEVAVPRLIRRRFSRLAGLLELADEEFLAIRAELASRQRSADAEISRGNLDIEIDLTTLTSFAESDSGIAELDEFISSQAGYSGTLLSFDKAFIEVQVPAIIKNGFKQISELSDFITDRRRAIEAFSTNWITAGHPYGDVDNIAQREGTGAGSYRLMDRPPAKGISLFYIALLCDAKKYTEGRIPRYELMFPGYPERYKDAWNKTARELGEELWTRPLS
jgi:putative GTP pyrophosphokinase